jgi:hypothetical protein
LTNRPLQLKSTLKKLATGIVRLSWAFIVAFMVGIHNFYKGEDKSPDNMVKTEINEGQEDGAPGPK